MGSYGIGVGRNMAAVVESRNDEAGILWPVSIAPYEVVITIVKMDDESSVAAAEQIYAGLLAEGIDAIIDDRDERPGVKFADSEIIGIPLRINVGPRGLADGNVELVRRADRSVETVGLAEAVAAIVEEIRAARAR